MSDYIKREDAIFIALQQPFYSLISEIKQLEGIDIVRCGECMHNGSYDTDCPFGWRNGEWNLPKPCDFCSYGELMKGADDEV